MSTEHHLNTNNKEITLFFNGRDFEDRLVYAEMKRIHEFGYRLNGVDVSEKKLEVGQAERITRDLGGNNPQSVLNEEFLKSYLVSHVNNFNEFNTVGQLLEDSTTLKTPIIIKDGIMEYLDTSRDVVYEELKEEYELLNKNDKKEVQPNLAQYLMHDYKTKQMFLYFSILILVVGILYQILSYEKSGTANAEQVPKARMEVSSSFVEI